MSKSKNYEEQNFYQQLGIMEGSRDYTKENFKTRYIGLYQMGEDALTDAGYYKKAPSDNGLNSWKGSWTEKGGIHNKDDTIISTQKN